VAKFKKKTSLKLLACEYREKNIERDGNKYDKINYRIFYSIRR
jgi:hypothetical protein